MKFDEGMVKYLHFWRTLKSSRVAQNHLPKEIFTGICRPSFCDSTTRSLIHLKFSHMVKINYFHEVLLNEWNTCLWNLIILHPKRQRNIPQNQPSTHLDIAQKYLSVLNDVVLHARLSNLFNKMVHQMTILTEFGNLHISLK